MPTVDEACAEGEGEKDRMTQGIRKQMNLIFVTL